VAGRLDGEVRAATDGRAERDEQLGEDRDRISLGMGSQLRDDLARQAVVGIRSGLGGPERRWGKDHAAARRLLLEETLRVEGHSAVISLTATRALDSSTIRLPAANAQISDPVARLLTCLGSPRETCAIRLVASSLNSVSERPASAR
jgi:hypothetical protein